jgi:hypothetical protein
MARLMFLPVMLAVLLTPPDTHATLSDAFQMLRGPTVPRAARAIADQMDAQLMRRIGPAGADRSTVLIISTVSVSLNDVSKSCPLSRQISEEIVNVLLDKGYRVNELRKGKEIVMRPDAGEMLLTRELPRLATREVQSVAVLAGTYLVTPDNVRFNMRLIHTPDNEVIAMGSATVPVTREIKDLLADEKRPAPPRPSVFTRLP